MRMQNLPTLLALLASSTAFAGFSHHDDHDLARDVFAFRPHGGGHLAARVLQCGDTVTASMALAADLVCPTTTGFALNVIGDNIVLDGNGHKIVAPLASAGVFVQGSNDTIRELRINGIQGGDGILAYETPGIKITDNDVSSNGQGIALYADTGAVTDVKIQNNLARNNALFGIRTGFDAPGAIVSPQIRNNDLGGNGSFGMLIKATKFELDGNHGNSFQGSRNGIYLAGGDAFLHDFSLAHDHIQQTGVFADSLDNLMVNNVDVSSLVPASASQERTGMHLYRVANFAIKGFDGSKNDLGLKLDTELGVSPAGTVTDSSFLDNVVSGILVASYDGTPFGLLSFTRNCYRDATRVLVAGGTLLASGSITDDGLNACGRDNDHDRH